MLGVGFGEMILIAGVALVVIGPEKFPEFAKIVLRTIRDLRGYVEDAKQDIARELKPVRKELQDLSKYNPEDYIESLAGAVVNEGEEDAGGDADGTRDEGNGEAGGPPPGTESEQTAGEEGEGARQSATEDLYGQDPNYDTGDAEAYLADAGDVKDGDAAPPESDTCPEADRDEDPDDLRPPVPPDRLDG